MKSALSLFALLLSLALQSPALAAVRTVPVDQHRQSSNAPPELYQGLHTQDAILFQNGDFLFGRLDSIQQDKHTRWKHPDAPNLIEFKPENVTEIFFRHQPAQRRTNNCTVRLTNEDSLEGNLVSCDAETLTLDTWYAGRLVIPRNVVQTIFPIPVDRPPLFVGPTGLEGWTLGKVSSIAEAGEWIYHDGAFYATKAASIARDVNLPDLASIQFDLAWKGSFNFALALYTDYLYPISLGSKENEPDFGGFYSLQFNSYSANLLPIRKSDPLKYVGTAAMIPAFNQKTSAHVEVRVNKAKSLIALLVDGTLVRQWVDEDGFIGEGTAIRLVNQAQSKLKVSNLVITEWDGQFEDKTPVKLEMQQDLVRLRNGDKVVGDLQSIVGETVVFAIAGSTTIDIPFYRVKQIDFAGYKTLRNRDSISDVRAFFPHGGSVTFQIEKWDESGVLAFSPNFGKATFIPTAFSRVQLNIQ